MPLLLPCFRRLLGRDGLLVSSTDLSCCDRISISKSFDVGTSESTGQSASFVWLSLSVRCPESVLGRSLEAILLMFLGSVRASIATLALLDLLNEGAVVA